MSFDWKNMLGTVAPMLGTAIGGPFGAMAGKMLGSALLDDEDATDAQIEQALMNASPETILKVKQAELNLTATMKELGIKEQDLHLKDRQNAREMAVKTSLVPQMVLSAVFITGYFTILVLMGIYPEFKVDPMTFGIITVSIPVIMQFWFGSSQGSKTKKSA